MHIDPQRSCKALQANNSSIDEGFIGLGTSSSFCHRSAPIVAHSFGNILFMTQSLNQIPLVLTLNHRKGSSVGMAVYLAMWS